MRANSNLSETIIRYWHWYRYSEPIWFKSLGGYQLLRPNVWVVLLSFFTENQANDQTYTPLFQSRWLYRYDQYTQLIHHDDNEWLSELQQRSSSSKKSWYWPGGTGTIEMDATHFSDSNLQTCHDTDWRSIVSWRSITYRTNGHSKHSWFGTPSWKRCLQNLSWRQWRFEAPAFGKGYQGPSTATCASRTHDIFYNWQYGHYRRSYLSVWRC